MRDKASVNIQGCSDALAPISSTAYLDDIQVTFESILDEFLDIDNGLLNFHPRQPVRCNGRTVVERRKQRVGHVLRLRDILGFHGGRREAKRCHRCLQGGNKGITNATAHCQSKQVDAHGDLCVLSEMFAWAES